MWREYITDLWSDTELQIPVSDTELAIAEREVGMPFPLELKALYSETNGVYLTDAYMWIVWPLNELIKRNAEMHSDKVAFYKRAFDDLFFFGDLGNGDLLAFSRSSAASPYISVGKWDHEDGEYRPDGTQLRECLEA